MIAFLLLLVSIVGITWLGYTVVIAFRVIVSLSIALWAVAKIAVSIVTLIGELIVAAIPRREAPIAHADNVIPFRRQ